MFWYIHAQTFTGGGPEPSVKQPHTLISILKYDTCINYSKYDNASSNEQLLPTNKDFNGEENGKELS